MNFEEPQIEDLQKSYMSKFVITERGKSPSNIDTLTRLNSEGKMSSLASVNRTYESEVK